MTRNIVPVQFSLDDGTLVAINLPMDLTAREADRLYAMTKAWVINPSPEKEK